MIQVPARRERKDHGREWRPVGQATYLFWKAERLPNVVVCFMAYAVYKFKEALKLDGEDDLPTGEDDTIDETTDAGNKQALAKKRNVVDISLWPL